MCMEVVIDSSKGVCLLFFLFCSGVWNVPHVSAVYLVKGAWLKRHTPEYSSERFEVDMAFTAWMREKVGCLALHAPCGNGGLTCGSGVLAVLQGHFMYVTNLEEYGHLVNPDGYSTEHLNNDMYEIFNNRKVCAGCGFSSSVWCFS